MRWLIPTEWKESLCDAAQQKLREEFGDSCVEWLLAALLKNLALDISIESTEQGLMV